MNSFTKYLKSKTNKRRTIKRRIRANKKNKTKHMKYKRGG
jgi:hypothetical protein